MIGIINEVIFFGELKCFIFFIIIGNIVFEFEVEKVSNNLFLSIFMIEKIFILIIFVIIFNIIIIKKIIVNIIIINNLNNGINVEVLKVIIVV